MSRHRTNPVQVLRMPDRSVFQDLLVVLRRFTTGKSGLLFRTKRGTPHLYNNLEDRWLTPRLMAMGLDEDGMGWHSIRRFRNTWLRGKRTQEDVWKY